MNFACHYRINRGLFAVETFRRALVNQHIFTNRRCLDNRIIWTKIALQNCYAARRPVGIVDRVNNIWAHNFCVLDSVAQSASDCQRVEIEQIFLGKFMHDSVNAARLVKVLHVMISGGTKLCNIRRSRRNFVKKRRGDFNSALVRNRG